MIFSPIFYIELLTVGRRKRYFISRVIYASLLLTVMGFCYLAAFEPLRSQATLQDQAEFAFLYFIAFSWIQIITVLGLTPAMMAGTISVEHERKTIDYLLTTQLSDTEIALGKFAARLWSVIMQLAVGVPILAIGLMLGGVSPEQMFASFGVSFFVMAASIIDSRIFQGIFSSDEMRHVWSDENRTAKYIEIERALAVVQGRLGLIPQEAADEIVSHCKLEKFDLDLLRQQTERIGYPILGVVSQLNKLCRDKLGEYCHWGATTQDITDTATVLQIREGLAIVERELAAIAAALARLAKDHRDTPMIGRSNLQQGDPGHLRLQDGGAAVGHRSAIRTRLAAVEARGCWSASSPARPARWRLWPRARWRRRPA